MIPFLISALKIIVLLGFLVFIHEGGHFLMAKLCKVTVNEFAIGFGPKIWEKQGKETKYALRLIPLGGFVSMEGETETSEKEGSFSKASIPKRLAIVLAGPIVNIVFAIVVFFVLAVIFGMNSTGDFGNSIQFAFDKTGGFLGSMFEGLAKLFTGQTGLEQMMGPVGISEVVANTSGLFDFVNMMAIISLSLGVTNLLPIPALDGGKILLLIIEAIRRKPLSQKAEMNLQLAGFGFLILLSIIVTYQDITRIF
ncbi:MAG: site-2 protease family protein [Clostridia bacterium]|nr:site-2 protease family protein [Clostridia bacterium]